MLKTFRDGLEDVGAGTDTRASEIDPMLKHTCLTALDSTHCSPGPFRSTVGYDDSRLPLLRYLLTGLDQPLYFRRSLVVEGSCFVEVLEEGAISFTAIKGLHHVH